VGQVVGVLGVVLGIGALVGVLFLFQLGVIVVQLTVIQILGVLLLGVQGADLVHQHIPFAGVAVQGQIVQGGNHAVQPVHLLLIGLLGRAGGVAGTIAAGQGGGLGGRVGAGVVGVLAVGLGVLPVQRVGSVVIGETLLG